MERINHLKKLLSSAGIDAALISKKESIYYLSGLIPHHPTEREAYLFISPTNSILYHSPFINPPNNGQLLTAPMSSAYPLITILQKTFPTSITSIGIEKTNLTVAELERISLNMPDKNFESIDTLVTEMRQIKDSQELQLLKTAGQIAAKTISWCKQWLNQNSVLGISENQVAQAIDAKMKLLGADEPSFPTIVAFDHNCAEPHHMSDLTRLKNNSIVLIDMGASVGLYKSDLTRTWARSKPTNPRFVTIQKIVRQAYRQAVKTATTTAPITSNMVDDAARIVINQAGFADNFIHTTGHGIGLEAHELPHISSTDVTPLSPGIAFTIEPGIYLPNQFGYRHENTFIMTETGAVPTTV